MCRGVSDDGIHVLASGAHLCSGDVCGAVSIVVSASLTFALVI